MVKRGTVGASPFFDTGPMKGKVQGTYKTQIERTRVPKRLQGGMWIVEYEDGITPGTLTAEATMDVANAAFAESLGNFAASRIRDIYDQGGQPTWKPVQPRWLYYKAMHNLDTRTMHMTNNLWEVTRRLEESIESHYDKSTGQVTIGGIGEAFEDADYVWWHELTGVGKSRTRRPFIFQGLQEALRTFYLSGDVTARLAEELAEWAPPFDIDVSGPAPVTGQYTIHQTRFHTALISLLWWFMPPHKILAVYGALMDAAAFASGELMSPQFLSAWLTAYGKGMAGGAMGVPTTEKMTHRSWRRRMYRPIQRGR